MLAGDEAYSELYFGEPPVSILQVADRTNVVAFNTLSKRSSMPGYRTGFVAGDPELIAALKHYRPNVGVAPIEFIQRAAVAAWGDEAHVEEVRGRYRAKRDVLLPVLERMGLRHAGGDATFFLWLEAGEDADALAERWLEAGVIVAPGLVLRARGRGLPALRARPHAGGVRARGQRAGGAVLGHGAACSSWAASASRRASSPARRRTGRRRGARARPGAAAATATAGP